MYKFLMGRIKKTEPGSSLGLPSDRTRSIRHKLKWRKFLLNMKKNNQLYFNSLRLIKEWNELPREAVKS